MNHRYQLNKDVFNMTYDLKTDIVSLSSLTQADVKRIVTLCCDLIGNDVFEDVDSLTTVDIGIGNLYISRIDEGICYKFIPSNELEKTLLEGVRKGKSTLVDKIESSISNVIVHSYTDLV